jgi:hypothetical protein
MSGSDDPLCWYPILNLLWGYAETLLHPSSAAHGGGLSPLRGLGGFPGVGSPGRGGLRGSDGGGYKLGSLGADLNEREDGLRAECGVLAFYVIDERQARFFVGRVFGL